MSSSHKHYGNPVRQIVVQRRNLVAVCRLAVKTLIERSCFDPIEDAGEELHNFCSIMEHILSHRLKPSQTWYGAEEPRPFWDYIRAACRDIPHNCIPSIETVEKPKSARGKGRAWLRMALMEKRLHDYITHALQQIKITRSFYCDGALLLSEDSNVLSGILLGLNAIDFSFDIRGENLDQPNIPVIDFTPYLKFDQIRDFLHDEHRELRDLGRLMSMSLDSDVFIDENSDTWRGRYYKVDAKFRVVSEQKGYLEELVRLRESQMEEDHRQRQKLIETLQHFEAESRRERQQLETVIIELQAQLGNVKEEHRLKLQQMQMLLHRYTTELPTFHPPDIALRDMASLPLIPNAPTSHSPWNPNELAVVSTVPHIPTPRPPQMDSKSIISGASCVSVASRHDTQSMMPLAGSLGSHTSYMSNEACLQAVATALQSGVKRVEEDPSESQPQDEGSSQDQSTAGNHIRRLSASPFASPIIRQGHVNEDQDPDESDSSEHQKGEPHRVVIEQKSSEKQEDETIIPSDRDVPKPDLVTSCDSTFESSENYSEKDDIESMGKQGSTDDAETVPEESVAVKIELPATQEEEGSGN